MSDAQNQQSNAPRQPSRDLAAVLAQMVPNDPAERRRAVAALLRALVGEEPQGGI
jgi:hypothetical protein